MISRLACVAICYLKYLVLFHKCVFCLRYILKKMAPNGSRIENRGHWIPSCRSRWRMTYSAAGQCDTAAGKRRVMGTTICTCTPFRLCSNITVLGSKNDTSVLRRRKTKHNLQSWRMYNVSAQIVNCWCYCFKVHAIKIINVYFRILTLRCK